MPNTRLQNLQELMLRLVRHLNRIKPKNRLVKLNGMIDIIRGGKVLSVSYKNQYNTLDTK